MVDVQVGTAHQALGYKVHEGLESSFLPGRVVTPEGAVVEFSIRPDPTNAKEVFDASLSYIWVALDVEEEVS